MMAKYVLEGAVRERAKYFATLTVVTYNDSFTLMVGTDNDCFVTLSNVKIIQPHEHES
jgi:hypothetical protein